MNTVGFAVLILASFWEKGVMSLRRQIESSPEVVDIRRVFFCGVSVNVAVTYPAFDMVIGFPSKG